MLYIAVLQEDLLLYSTLKGDVEVCSLEEGKIKSIIIHLG